MIFEKVRYLAPWRRRAAEREMMEELESIAAVSEPGELGSLALAAENARGTWRFTASDGFWADLRYAARLLARQPGIALIASLSLALGIGANSAIFSFANAILLRPLPVPDPARLLAVAAATKDSPVEGLSAPEIRDVRAALHSVSGLAAYRAETAAVRLRSGGAPQSRLTLLANPEFFETLGVIPQYGSLHLPESQPVVVLSYEFWKGEFDADPSVVGRPIWWNGVACQVAGILPESFTGLDLLFRPALYAPLSLSAQPEDRARHDLAVKARLAPGVSAAAARAEIANAGAAFLRQYPQPGVSRQFVALGERSFRVQQYPFRVTALLSMAALAMIVLLIACANVANLLLARARARGREMAIRLAIGAGRIRLVRQLLIEGLTLSLLGGLGGLALAGAIMRFLGRIQVSSDQPITLDLPVDTSLLAFNAAIAIAACLLAAIAPAIRAARTDIVSSLRSREGSDAGSRSGWGRGVSVGAQVALALVLMTVAGAYWNASRSILSAARGFRTDHRITLELDTMAARYPAPRAYSFYQRLRERAVARPGVRSVALCESLPYSPNQSSIAVIPESYTFPPGKDKDVILGGAVDEQYFETIGIPVVGGRSFTRGDRGATRRVAVVNQEFARQYWPGRDPIGRRVRIDGADWEVVGIAGNSRHLAPSEPPRPYVYLPYEQRQRPRMTLVVQSAGDSAGLAGPLRDTVRSLDPDLPVLNLRTLAAHENRTVENWFIFVKILTGLGVIGLALALGGVYGLVSYSVSRRKAEIGVRMAVGATPGAIARLVLRQGLRPAVVGILIGAVLSAMIAPKLAIGVQGSAAEQRIAALVLPLLLLGACAAASYLPARRAANLPPAETIWQD